MFVLNYVYVGHLILTVMLGGIFKCRAICNEVLLYFFAVDKFKYRFISQQIVFIFLRKDK